MRKNPGRHHHGNLRQALIDHALKAARKGEIEQMSLRQASEVLGVSPGAVYRHFKDKEALLRSLAALGFDMLAADFEAVLPFDSSAADAEMSRARFVALAKAYAQFAASHYGLWRLMFGPYGFVNVPPPQSRPEAYAWLGKSLAEMHKHGIIRDVSASAQFFVWATVHGLSDLHASPSVAEEQGAPIQPEHIDRLLAALR